MLIQGVYPYECMDSLEQFNETKVSRKTEFYNNLNTKNVTDTVLAIRKIF